MLSHQERVDPGGNVATCHMQRGLAQPLHIPIDRRQAKELSWLQAKAEAAEQQEANWRPHEDSVSG